MSLSAKLFHRIMSVSSTPCVTIRRSASHNIRKTDTARNGTRSLQTQPVKNGKGGRLLTSTLFLPIALPMLLYFRISIFRVDVNSPAVSV